MKKLMITGGMFGFLIGIGFGAVTEGSEWPPVLLRASVAAVCSGLLLRWLGTVWMKCLQDASIEKLAARAIAENQTNPLKK